MITVTPRMNGNSGCWVGIDVAKSKLDMAWLDERGKIKNHVFNNDAHLSLQSLAMLKRYAGAVGCELQVKLVRQMAP